MDKADGVKLANSTEFRWYNTLVAEAPVENGKVIVNGDTPVLLACHVKGTEDYFTTYTVAEVARYILKECNTQGIIGNETYGLRLRYTLLRNEADDANTPVISVTPRDKWRTLLDREALINLRKIDGVLHAFSYIKNTTTGNIEETKLSLSGKNYEDEYERLTTKQCSQEVALTTNNQ